MPFFCYNKNDYCDHSENCDNCEVWVFGKGGKEVPTNADRIRAMSDEELWNMFAHRSLCYAIQDNDPKFCEARGSCDNCIQEWLKQPAEVDHE